MKTLHRYLLRQVAASLALTVAVFTLVLLLGSLLREILPLLISQKAPLGLMAQAIGLLIPFVVSFALPIGMLTASLLVFGRFSADQELTAARASGVSLLSLVTPIVFFSVFLCGVSMALNLEIAPRSRVACKNLMTSVKVALIDMQLPEDRPITNFPGYILYTAKNRKRELQDVRVYKLTNDIIELSLNAPRGRIEADPQGQKLILRLYDVQATHLLSGMPLSSKEVMIPLDLAQAKKGSGEPKISDMTFSQLRNKLRELEKLRDPDGRADQSPPSENTSAGEPQVKPRAPRKDIIAVIRMQIHRRWAFSFACFGFTLIGIPLGIRMHRRETNIGIAIALALLAVYYALIIIADSLTGRPGLAPQLLMWLPNFLFQAVGAVLLWRANRGI